MLEESIPAIWASMQSWLTPTVFFVVLNLVIGTILATSGVGGQKTGEKPPDGDKPPSNLPTVQERIRSVKLHNHKVDEISAVTKTATILPDEISAVDELFHDGADSQHLERSRSDTQPTAGEVPAKLSRKMRKSASDKSAFNHFKEEEVVVEQRHPESVRVGRRVEAFTGEDSGENEVDTKADDFINRFKQQLKLQRMESIMRYKEMLHGGN